MKAPILIIVATLSVAGTLLQSQTVSGEFRMAEGETATLSAKPGLVKQDLVAKFHEKYGADIPDIVRVDNMYDCRGLPVVTFHMANGLAFGEMHGEEVKLLIQKHLLEPGEVLLTADIGAWYVLRKESQTTVVSTSSASSTETRSFSGSVHQFTLEKHDHPKLGPICFFNGAKGKVQGGHNKHLVEEFAGGKTVQVIQSGAPGEGLLYIEQ
jgi:hypothetical protein